MSAHELSLEPWTEDDLDLMRRLLGDPAMMTHLGGPESEEKLAQRLERFVSDPRQSRVVLAGGEAIGSVGYWDRTWRDEPVYETGWFVVPEWHGHGIASRATAMAIDRAATDGVRWMHAFPAVDNEPSNRVCAKLGFMCLEALEFEYPPGSGDFLRCNDWRLDLASWSHERHAPADR